MAHAKRLTATVSILGAAAMVASATSQPHAEWRYFGGDKGYTRYSALDQINRQNVQQLQLAWSWAMDDTGSQQPTPLVYDGIMYLPNPRGVIQALDAATGALRWSLALPAPDGEHHEGASGVRRVWEELFEQNRRFEPGRHYGSRLAWLPDGSLLMSIGDRGESDSAQDTGDHAGSVLRLGADGLAPEDNPHIGHAEILPEIYSWGHRNVQGLVVDPENGTIWATEHGPRGGDELNRIEAGRNYGWPAVSRGRAYDTEGPLRGAVRSARLHDDDMVDPIHEFLPTFAPSGLALVTSDRYPHWQGNLIAGGLGAERAYRIVLEEDEVVHMEELLLGRVGRIRDIREGPDGYLYVLSDDAQDGGLYRLEPLDD